MSRRAPASTPPDEEEAQPVITRELATALEELLGRWVAVFEGQVVASGATAKEASEGALQAGVTDPLLFRVPSHPERLNFL